MLPIRWLGSRLPLPSWRTGLIAGTAVLMVACLATRVLAQATAAVAEQTLDLWTMVVGMLGGLALFLFGMEQMADALKALAADRLKDVLARLTTNRLMGALTGAAVTAVIQSSSVTTVLVVGFISAGIMSVPQSVGVIFGSNIGSTVTAQLIAFKVTAIALPMVAIGFAMLFISRRDRVRHYGGMLMGLGLVFYGMGLMSDAMEPLREYRPFLDLMQRMENPFLGILVATLFTGLVQSSAATTGIIIVMAGQGLITLHAGIALVFGANIGTCATALLASVGKPREALRASVVHLLFNVIGVVLWVWFIDPLARLVTALSPAAESLSGVARMAAEAPRQIANAHTVFNVANTLLFLPFGGQFARLAELLVPGRRNAAAAAVDVAPQWTAVHLDPGLLAVPAIALEQTRGEIRRLSRMIRSLVERLVPAYSQGDVEAAAAMLKQEAEIDFVGERIDQYLVQIARRDLNQDQSEIAVQLTEITTSLERIAELFKRDLHPLIKARNERPVPDGEAGHPELLGFADLVLRNYDKAIRAFEERSTEAAREVVRSKPEVARSQQACRASRYGALGSGDPEAVAAGEIYLDLVDHLRRINSHAEAVAFTMLEGFLDARRRKSRTKAKGTPAPTPVAA